MKHLSRWHLNPLSAAILAVVRGVFSGWLPSKSRRISLDAAGNVRRFIIDAPEIALSELGAGKQSWVTLTREGKFNDPRYGDFEISADMLSKMVKNFSANVYGQKIFIDIAHKPNDGAAGEVIKLSHERKRLRALVQWTPLGVDAINNKGYSYMSIEYDENFTDNEFKRQHGTTMLGAGLVVRPALKHLDPVERIQLAESAGDVPTFLHPELEQRLLKDYKDTKMNKEQMLKQLREKLAARGFSLANIEKIIAAATKQLEAISDEATIKALAEAYDVTVETLVAQGGNKESVTINLNAPSTPTVAKVEPAKPAEVKALTEADVARLFAEADAKRDAATKKLNEDLNAVRVKLAAKVNAVTGVPEEARAKLLKDVDGVLAAGMSDAQIDALGNTLVVQLNSAAIASQLAARGYHPQGSVILTQDQSNGVKKLQEDTDKRLRLGAFDPKRAISDVSRNISPAHQEFMNKVLAQFDAQHGMRLDAEIKMLAGGTGTISDVAVPTIWERTVIREQLYELVGLNFVNASTDAFADIIRIPYSFRDTTGASRDSIRVYEGQGIPRAGVKQTYDEARPLPQKIAFLLSDEMQLLSTNGGIDYDAMADNVRNCGRILGEDTERLIFDEHVRAADEYSPIPIVSEAVANVNGTNKYFTLTQFPIVKPRTFFDLKGVLQNTQNQIVVTYNSIVRVEYNGTNTQAAGIYYVLDYSVGEIYMVSELGVVVTPAGATPFTVSYFYTANSFKFDTDLGALTVQQKWDNFLYQFGLRKSVIEDQRFYGVDFGLMSGNVRSQIEQAGGFQANFAKSGTNLTTDGNLGIIKGVPQYKTVCPGLQMGDRRVVIGQRNQVRFRMLKPWAMEQLQPARNAGGLFTAQKEAYGTQWIVVQTPTLLRGSLTTMTLFSTTARVARATP